MPDGRYLCRYEKLTRFPSPQGCANKISQIEYLDPTEVLASVDLTNVLSVKNHFYIALSKL